MNALTLLAGINGMGKSSVIQASLILRQSFKSGDLAEGRLLLAGDLVDLGTGSDVLCESATDDNLGLTILAHPNIEARFIYKYDKDADTLVAAGTSHDRAILRVAMDAIGDLPLFSEDFAYVQAERTGPRKMQPMSESRVRNKDLGLHGEYVLHALDKRGAEALADGDLRCKPESSCNLGAQVDAWLQDVSPGCHLEIALVRAADSAIASYRFDRHGDISTRSFRATNVGFGISYSLPVIFALLSAKPGSLILLENPEAHLHPRGQTKLGQLAARAAASGVQVVAETHSDHFMDGVRIEVKSGRLSPSLCSINYFSRTGPETQLSKPAIDEDGRLSFWPEGFFDQHEENLAALISPKKA